MEFVVITLTAFLVSAITLFSGFGLGTVLMPAFAIFFPVPIAIAATAIVHLANNVFKFALLGRQADWHVVLSFALPAAAAAILGAGTMLFFAGMPPITHYAFLGTVHEVTALKLVIGALIVVFALLELSPVFSGLAIARQYLVLGGILSGFFGGLSGNQGAFRSAFLIKAVSSKEAFVATGVVAAVIVDVTRLVIYGASYLAEDFVSVPREALGVVAAATLAAFAGAYLGRRLLKRIAFRSIKALVAAAMICVGVGLSAGLL